METIRGKTSLEIPTSEFTNRISNYRKVKMDIGTGDGRYVRCLAQKNSDTFFIGIDACRENLRENSQAKLLNALYVIANAQALPHELAGLADEITINFPWGSLLGSLLTGDLALFSGLVTVCKPTASLQVLLNSGALQEAGWRLEDGTQEVYRMLCLSGFLVGRPTQLNARDLRTYPTTWARRLAFGRDPRAYCLSARWAERIPQPSMFQLMLTNA
jgi:16S rRNA (adenine(1408)-N(1))-methyltransferase